MAECSDSFDKSFSCSCPGLLSSSAVLEQNLYLHLGLQAVLHAEFPDYAPLLQYHCLLSVAQDFNRYQTQPARTLNCEVFLRINLPTSIARAMDN
eukprot:1473435-Amphidinium_carterae.1